MTYQLKHNHYLVLAFSFISGYIDVLGILSIGGVFLSFMSGNSTRLAIQWVEGSSLGVYQYASVIIAFVFGAFVGSLMNADDSLKGIQRIIKADISLLIIAFLIELASLPFPSFIFIAIAMGIQNKAQVQVNNATIGKGFMTGVLYSLGDALARLYRKQTHFKEITTIFITWFSFFCGALLGTFTLKITTTVPALGFAIILLSVQYWGFLWIEARKSTVLVR